MARTAADLAGRGLTPQVGRVAVSAVPVVVVAVLAAGVVVVVVVVAAAVLAEPVVVRPIAEVGAADRLRPAHPDVPRPAVAHPVTEALPVPHRDIDATVWRRAARAFLSSPDRPDQSAFFDKSCAETRSLPPAFQLRDLVLSAVLCSVAYYLCASFALPAAAFVAAENTASGALARPSLLPPSSGAVPIAICLAAVAGRRIAVAGRKLAVAVRNSVGIASAVVAVGLRRAVVPQIQAAARCALPSVRPRRTDCCPAMGAADPEMEDRRPGELPARALRQSVDRFAAEAGPPIEVVAATFAV